MAGLGFFAAYELIAMPALLDHTFVVPAFRDSPFLESCLDSLHAQSQSSHIILATSTPSPFLEETAKKYAIPLLVHEPTTGIADDWTFAYNAATTRYITLAHQDDLYLPEYSARLVAAAERHPRALLVFSDYCDQVGNHLVASSMNLVIKRFILFWFFAFHDAVSRPAVKKLMLSAGNPIPCPTVLFDRENVGEFRFSSEFSVDADWEAWLRLARYPGPFIRVPRRLVVHRIHAESETSAAIAASRRFLEDEALFLSLWPKPIGRALSRLYSASYSSNRAR